MFSIGPVCVRCVRERAVVFPVCWCRLLLLLSVLVTVPFLLVLSLFFCFFFIVVFFWATLSCRRIAWRGARRRLAAAPGQSREGGPQEGGRGQKEEEWFGFPCVFHLIISRHHQRAGRCPSIGVEAFGVAGSLFAGGCSLRLPQLAARALLLSSFCIFNSLPVYPCSPPLPFYRYACVCCSFCFFPLVPVSCLSRLLLFLSSVLLWPLFYLLPSVFDTFSPPPLPLSLYACFSPRPLWFPLLSLPLSLSPPL